VRMAEDRATGVFNATGPEPRPTMEEVLDACRTVANPDARLVWVDPEFLLKHEVDEWMELPLWIVDPSHAGFLDADVAKAVAHGLTFRPLAETIRATVAEAAPTDDAGMRPDRERDLLAEFASLASGA